MKIGVIGFGDHVVRNILPCFEKIKEFESSIIFVRDKEKYHQKANEYHVQLENNFPELLKSVNIIYIATPIPQHSFYARKSLEAGIPVWCEKAFGTSFEETLSLVTLAKEKNVFLAECIMYFYHPQFKALKESLNEHSNLEIEGASARFSIPDYNGGGQHYTLKESGGAFLDQGVYPLSLGLALFGWPQEFTSNLNFLPNSKIEYEGEVEFKYKNFAYKISWKNGGGYENNFNLISDRGEINVERAFSKPPDFMSSLQGSFFQHEKLNTGEHNHFSLMFSMFLENQNSTKFAKRMRKHILERAFFQEFILTGKIPKGFKGLISAKERIKQWS